MITMSKKLNEQLDDLEIRINNEKERIIKLKNDYDIKLKKSQDRLKRMEEKYNNIAIKIIKKNNKNISMVNLIDAIENEDANKFIKTVENGKSIEEENIINGVDYGNI